MTQNSAPAAAPLTATDTRTLELVKAKGWAIAAAGQGKGIAVKSVLKLISMGLLVKSDLPPHNGYFTKYVPAP